MKQIIVNIPAYGPPTVEAEGFNGEGCTAATSAIEKALNGQPNAVDREFKPEYSAPGVTGEAKATLRW